MRRTYVVMGWDGIRDRCDSRDDALMTAQEVANESGHHAYVFTGSVDTKGWLMDGWGDSEPIARRDPDPTYDGPHEQQEG